MDGEFPNTNEDFEGRNSEGSRFYGLAPRGAYGLLFDRWFGSLFWGKLLSGLGVWIHSLVAVLVVFNATGSALWAGLTTIVQFVPHIFLSTLSGKWSDRGNIVHQMILGRALCIFGTALIAVYSFVFGVPDDIQGSVAVLIGSAITGVGYVLGLPAQQSIIPLLIRPGELSLALALNSLPMTLARILGPALGAILALQVHVGYIFVFAATTHAIFIMLLVLAHLPTGAETNPDTDDSVRAAMVFVWKHKLILVLLIVVSAIGFGSEPSITLAPVVAIKVGGGTEFVGFITGSFGVGAALGFFVYRLARRWKSEGSVLTFGLVLMICGTILVTIANGPITVLLSFAIVGVGFTPALTAATTLIQIIVPSEMRGRIMALWSMGFIGSRPLSAGLSGYIADTVSLHASLIMVTIVLVLMLFVFNPRKVPLELSKSTM